jgi:hypothetical protein
MRIDVSRFMSRRNGRFAGLVAGISVVLALAAPAWASGTTEATATLAPIGTGSYLLTIKNTGSEEIGGFFINGENLTNIAPAGTCGSLGSSAACTYPIAPGASAQICYSGPSVETVVLGGTIPVHVSSAPAIASCPVAGFTPAPSGGGGGTGGSGASGNGAPGGSAPVPTAECVVPALKGKTVAKAKKKLTAADCTLGKVKGKKGKSAKVTKQSPAPGKTLAAGAKVGVTVK